MYQQPVTSMAKSVRTTPPPQGPPPPAPSPRMGQSGTAVSSPGYQMAPERPPVPERSHLQSNYMNTERRQDYYYSPSADRRLEHHRSYPTYLTPSSSYEDPYYGDRSFGGSRSGSVTPIIDEEARARVEFMERQLASLTGLVHKALTTPRPPSVPRDPEMAAGRELLQVPATRESSTYKSDDFKPESKTVPRPLSKEREQRQLGKPAPPPKPSGLGPGQHDGKVLMSSSSRDLQITPEMYNQLRLLKKKTKDLRSEVRNLRRMTQAQAVNVRETIRDTSMKLKAMLSAVETDDDQVHGERIRVSREEELYRQDVAHLEKDLSDLESAVEDLRSNVINRRCRVNMSEVESMALVLSKASKTVADLKARFPPLQESLKSVMSAEMEAVVREEKFLKEGPERLENALRRCKKLTGTLVTLKRLASVQEQRLPPASPGIDHRASSLPTQSSLPETHLDGIVGSHDDPLGKAASFSGEVSRQSSVSQKVETSLDALLDELQTIARPTSANASPTSTVFSNEQRRSSDISVGSSGSAGAFKRLPSYPSNDSPLKGQIVSQGPGGSVTVPVNTSLVNKVQVSDTGGNRQATSSGPASAVSSPAPCVSSSTTLAQDLFSKVSVGRVEICDAQQQSPSPTVTTATSTTAPAVAARKVPPPPPPRTSSKSPLVSPTSPMAPPIRVLPARSASAPNSNEPPPVPAKPSAEGLRRLSEDLDSQQSQMRREAHQMTSGGSMVRTSAISEENLLLRKEHLSSNSSSSESVNSQEGVSSSKLSRADSAGSASGRGTMFNGSSQSGNAQGNLQQVTGQHPPLPPARNRQEILEQRHQELLRRQRQLQEQYARLQQLQRGQTLQKFSPPCGHGDLKKTGSESNINVLSKAGLSMSTASGSLTHLATVGAHGSTAIHLPSSLKSSTPTSSSEPPSATSPNNQSTTSKIYETDIL